MKVLTPKIIFEDANLIVLSKPAGMLSQPDSSDDLSLVDWLRKYVGREYVGLIHRLDRGTSGVMVIAKRTKAARRLTESLQKGELERQYLTWVIGGLKEKDPIRWTHWLYKNERTNQTSVVNKGRPSAKEAVLLARPVEKGLWKGTAITLLEVTLETGRSHQIRVQLAHEGLPILGDFKYGAGKTCDFGRPALHSHQVRFPHPIGGRIMEFEDPLPADMEALRIL